MLNFQQDQTLDYSNLSRSIGHITSVDSSDFVAIVHGFGGFEVQERWINEMKSSLLGLVS